MTKTRVAGEAVSGVLGIATAILIGALGVAVIIGAGSQHATIGVIAGVLVVLYAIYRAVNVIYWTRQDIQGARGR